MVTLNNKTNAKVPIFSKISSNLKAPSYEKKHCYMLAILASIALFFLYVTLSVIIGFDATSITLILVFGAIAGLWRWIISKSERENSKIENEEITKEEAIPPQIPKVPSTIEGRSNSCNRFKIISYSTILCLIGLVIFLSIRDSKNENKNGVSPEITKFSAFTIEFPRDYPLSGYNRYIENEFTLCIDSGSTLVIKGDMNWKFKKTTDFKQTNTDYDITDDGIVVTINTLECELFSIDDSSQFDCRKYIYQSEDQGNWINLELTCKGVFYNARKELGIDRYERRYTFYSRSIDVPPDDYY